MDTKEILLVRDNIKYLQPDCILKGGLSIYHANRIEIITLEGIFQAESNLQSLIPMENTEIALVYAMYK